jgi:hypothetical protein
MCSSASTPEARPNRASYVSRLRHDLGDDGVIQTHPGG